MASDSILSSGPYAAFVVGFAIMTDSMIYTLVGAAALLAAISIVLAQDNFELGVAISPRFVCGTTACPGAPKYTLRQFNRFVQFADIDSVSQWTALAFEVFGAATILSNAVVGFFVEASTSKTRPFLLSAVIMVLSTVVFFLGTTPMMIVVSRAIQGASVTFTWVTGLAFLVSQVEERDLGAYVGWTTAGVAIGEIIGPMIGGPIYDYFGHWAAFGLVEVFLLIDILFRGLAKEKKPGVDTDTPVEQDTEADTEQNSETDTLLEDAQASLTDYSAMNGHARVSNSYKSVSIRLAWEWLGTVFTSIVIFMIRGGLEVAEPLYLTRQYSWTPTKISLTLLTVTLPAVVNPVVGKLTSRHGPRWWSTGGFVVCGAALISFGNLTGHSKESQTLFIVHSAVVGIALAVTVNSNQVAISVASQRYMFARTQAKEKDENLGLILSWLSPSMMLSGVTTSWAVGILLGSAYTSLIEYTEDAGWAFFCRSLGCLCILAAVGSSFLWRKWQMVD